MSSVGFTVLGVPAPQGSKVRTKWGMREDNPNTKPWRDTIAWTARDAMMTTPPFVGPCSLAVTFYMPRPKAHFGTGKNANVLKASAPRYCETTPDLDKLLRALGDALTTAGVWKDDKQAVMVSASKRYVIPGFQTGCTVTVETLHDQPRLATRGALERQAAA